MSANFPPQPAVHLAESVRSVRRRYRKRLARCQEKFSEKAVHGLRTETRRILALLDLLEAFHFGEPLKKLRKTFKRRLDAFDDLRDTHVQRVLLRPLWPDFPEARELKKHLRKCEKRLEAGMSRKIRRTKSGDLNQCLKGLQKTLRTGAGGASDGRSDRLMHTLFNGAFRKVVLLRRQIRRDDPATIHRMRVAFKRFRYTAEFLQPFLPHFTKERIARMKEFQAAAGNIQDVAVLLERMAKDIKTGDVKPAWVKNLRSELLRRERRAIDSFMARIDELMDFEPERPASFTTEPEAVSE